MAVEDGRTDEANRVLEAELLLWQSIKPCLIQWPVSGGRSVESDGQL